MMSKQRKNREVDDGEMSMNGPLPFPDSDLPPQLQRTIKRKIEEGDEGIDTRPFKEALQRASRPPRSAS